MNGSLPSPGATRAEHVVVLLAAGAGTRFEENRHKLLANLDDDRSGAVGRTVLARSLGAALDAQIGPVVVVTGALDRTRLDEDPVVRDLLQSPEVIIAHNDAWADGQATSLQTAISVARSLGATGIVVGLADQPFVPPTAWRTVATGLGPIVVATYDGRRGNPVLLDAGVWQMLPTSGDEGARVLMRRRPDLVVEVPCTGSPADIDTVEDLRRWQSN